MYQALYRKWRPKTFTEVIGQSHITDTLRRQVEEGRTAHAYLFTGTRGTGKTTCARILAKAINCLHPVDGEPCNECEACRGIDEGTLLDITELDAASNNGVDHVRALREEAVYTPAVLKKRVYIIDEVHMLSTPAFNALLKILEEPPEHLVFILATTELHKVPATILSRCQRFSFKRILPRDMEKHLLHVAAAEQIDLQPDGAEILARMANGALRDALSLLDQCRAAEGTLDSRAVLEVLGLAGSVQTVQLMQRILERDAGSALMQLGELYGGGKDLTALLGELSDLTRDMMILKTAGKDGAAEKVGLLHVLPGEQVLREDAHRHILQKRHVRLGETESDGLRVDDGDLLDVLVVRRVLGAVLGVHDGLDGELDVIRCERLAVVPLHALAQVEGIGIGLLVIVPRLGEAGDDLVVAVVGGQAVEE